MTRETARRRYVIGPDGRPFGIADLPCVRTVRWVRSRKLAVATAVWGGLLTEEEACARYALTADELSEWIRAATGGDPGAVGVPTLSGAPGGRGN